MKDHFEEEPKNPQLSSTSSLMRALALAVEEGLDPDEARARVRAELPPAPSEPSAGRAKLVTTVERGRLSAAVTPCGDCGDTRAIFGQRDSSGYEVAIDCRCAALHRTAELVRLSGLRARAARTTFEAYSLHKGAEGDAQVVASRKAALDACRLFVKRYTESQSSVGVLLWGPNGTGKTHLLTAMLRVLIGRGVRVLFIEWGEFIASVKASFGTKTGERADEIIERAASVPVLAIDEIGAGQATEFEAAVIERVINGRYSEGLPTLYATNCVADPGTDGPGTLIDRLGRRAASRVIHESDDVFLAGPEFRALQKRARQAAEGGQRKP